LNFTLFKVDKPKRLKKLDSNKASFFKRHEDVELFHFNEIELNMFHIVYHLKDEYLVGTKRVGNQMHLPFTQFVNCFFFLDSNYFLIEEVLKEYQSDVTNHIQKKTNVTIERQILENDKLLEIQTNLNGFIKKVEYKDEDDDDYYLDAVSSEKLRELADDYTLDRLTMLIENQFLSVYHNGKISVDNSSENYLIKFTRDIINAITHNN